MSSMSNHTCSAIRPSSSRPTQLEQLVMRRPRARVCSAELQSGESQALASHGDNDCDRCCIAPISRRRLASRGQSLDGRSIRVKPTYLPATLDEDVGCVQLLDLVPGFAIESSLQRCRTLARTRCPARRSALRVEPGRPEDVARREGAAPFPQVPQHLSARTGPTARSAAARAPAASPAALSTVASARQASP